MRNTLFWRFRPRHNYCLDIELACLKTNNQKGLLPVESDSQPEEKRILVVDDETSILRIFKTILNKKYIVDTAVTGETAIILAEQYQYDLIFMDFRLGEGINGDIAALEIKKSERHKNTSIILCTAYDISNFENLSERGFTHFIQKPLKLDTLITITNEIFSNTK